MVFNCDARHNYNHRFAFRATLTTPPVKLSVPADLTILGLI